MSRKKSLVDKNFLLAIATLVGTAIGAGIFSLPYIASRSGFSIVMLMIFVLGIFMMLSNLMYGEITLRTEKKCRLVGYAEKYFGKKGRRFAAFAAFLSFYSGSLIYIILGGTFLNALLGEVFGGNEFLYSTALFAFVSLSIYFNLSLFSIIESWMVLFLLFVMSGIIFKSVPHIDLNNFITVDFHQWFLPFGAVLFSLSATSAIPELEHIIKKRQKRIKDAIAWGTVSYIMIYIVFISVILGVTGNQSTEDVFTGLSLFIGDGVVTFGLIFGFLAVLTSYLVTGISLKETFWYDYGLSEKNSWILTCIIPYLFFLLGVRNFIEVISFAGTLTGGISGILIILIFYKAKGHGKPAYQIKVPAIVSALMILIYLIGIVYQIVYKKW